MNNVINIKKPALTNKYIENHIFFTKIIPQHIRNISKVIAENKDGIINITPDLAGLTYKMPHRDKNEDALFLAYGFMAVFDETGSAKGGGKASKYAAEYFKAYFDKLKDKNLFGFTPTFDEANKTVNGHSSAQTTAVCALINGNKATIAHIGDSRAYLVSEGKISLLTVDENMFSVGFKPVDPVQNTGLIKAPIKERNFDNYYEGSRKSKKSKMLLPALGREDFKFCTDNLFSIELKKGDLLILASDGLNSLPLEEFKKTLQDNAKGTALEIAQALIKALEVLKDPHQDNVTIAVYKQAT